MLKKRTKSAVIMQQTKCIVQAYAAKSGGLAAATPWSPIDIFTA
jgi:hypothetical protein